uniref:TORC_C domain-containing protein n=1 Tax=Heterorhabditis bacteriophora TaxID=37862 RepID=A0A1I7XVV3_HETBA
MFIFYKASFTFHQERTITERQSIQLLNNEPNPLEVDLIQLNEEISEMRLDDDDLIFEDFTRLRLKGADSTDDPSPSGQQPPSLI